MAIGTVWENNTWADDTWADGTWADAGTVPAVDDNIVHIRVKIRDRSPRADVKHRPLRAEIYTRTTSG